MLGILCGRDRVSPNWGRELPLSDGSRASFRIRSLWLHTAFVLITVGEIAPIGQALERVSPAGKRKEQQCKAKGRRPGRETDNEADKPQVTPLSQGICIWGLALNREGIPFAFVPAGVPNAACERSKCVISELWKHFVLVPHRVSSAFICTFKESIAQLPTHGTESL